MCRENASGTARELEQRLKMLEMAEKMEGAKRARVDAGRGKPRPYKVFRLGIASWV
jgi:hypothetical protein